MAPRAPRALWSPGVPRAQQNISVPEVRRAPIALRAPGVPKGSMIPGSSSGSVIMKTEAQIFLARSSSSRLPFQAKNRSFVATNKFLFRPKNDRGVNSRLDLGTFPGHSCRFKKQVPENWSGFSPAQHFPECHSSKMNMMGDHLEALGKARV